MKRIALAILLASVLALPATSSAQKHRHTPRTENTASPNPSKGETDLNTSDNVTSDTAGIEVFSDTTHVDTTDTSSTHVGANGIDWDDDMDFDENISVRDLRDLLGLGVSGTVLGVVAIIVMLLVAIFPFMIIALIVWLIVRSRNRRYRIAEKAMENGQPIPDQFMEPEKTDTWQRGVKNIFIGVGIAVLFYCFGFESLAGIGWLVAICGVGQAVIGKASQRRNNNDIKPFN